MTYVCTDLEQHMYICEELNTYDTGRNNQKDCNQDRGDQSLEGDHRQKDGMISFVGIVKK